MTQSSDENKSLGWIYPWLDWTYANVEGGDEIVSEQLNMYGYTCFFAPIIALVPALLTQLLGFVTKSESKTNSLTLLSIMVIRRVSMILTTG